MRIAVVDPSRTILKAVSRLLKDDGHVVDAFTDGSEALAFIKSEIEVSALITSAQLGSMSGPELCWETRLLAGRDRPIYIILMSSDHTHLIDALDSGADEFIGKPPAREELYARLRSAQRLLGLQRELIELATVDSLTGLLNRRAFFEKAERLCQQASPSNKPVTIIFDVDHFKRVNDTHGHHAGDEVLRTIGRSVLETRTIAGRLGGEEFVVLLEGSHLERGRRYAEDLRRRIEMLPVATANGPISVTSSFGVAEWQPGEDIDGLLKRADAALYRAKNGGRNRVVDADAGAVDAAEAQWSQLLRSDPRSRAPARPQSQPPTWLPGSKEERMSESADIAECQPQGRRAFVLDDEPQIGALVCKVLQACGITARQFAAPAPFFAELALSAPDVILLDLSLGQSDAVEIIRQLETEKYRGKIVLISGHDEATLQEITRIGEKHGLAMLPPLKKPFRPAELRQRLSPDAAGAEPPKTPAVRRDSDPTGEPSIRLADALANNWLEVWYQPKVDLKSLSFCGAEALIRARHPAHGIITPDKFLPPAGDPDYQPLSKFVVERAMADWAAFAGRDVHLKLSVNAPVSVIHMPAFVALIRSVLPADPRFPGLIVEVTEDEVIRDSEWAREIATQLKLYNVGLSIDDFGSGYASLSRLNDLPFVEVKIDRSFVSGCASNQLKHGLCQTIVDLAHRFGATVCAEGVETTEDLRALLGMQCDAAQGFLFAKPMPAMQLTAAVLAAVPAATRAAMQTHSDRRLARTV